MCYNQKKHRKGFFNMTLLRQQMIQDMKLKGLSEKTINSYVRYIRDFALFYDKSPEQLGSKEIKEYLMHLIEVKKRSNVYLRGCYSAMKFIYGITMGQEWEKLKIPQIKRKRRLPEVLAKEEIEKILEVTEITKYRTMFMLMYGTGLRIGETVRLRVDDIDRNRKVIRVNQGKGLKDRYTLLPDVLMKELEKYYKRVRQNEWLFPGDKEGQHITERSVQRAFQQSKTKAAIRKKVSVHTLRHSFASHIVEAGYDVYHLQKLMGHSTVKTTNRYIQISRASALKVVSPLEGLLGDSPCLK